MIASARGLECRHPDRGMRAFGDMQVQFRPPGEIPLSRCRATLGRHDVYLAALLLPGTRRFFELNALDVGMVVDAVFASAIAIGALALCGFFARVAPDAEGGERR